MKRAVVKFECKALDQLGEFEGYGSTFGNVDFGRDMVMPGAFTESLKDWTQKNQFPLLPWYHDMATPIGDWLEMREDEKGLYVKGSLWVQEGKRIDKATAAHNLLNGTGPKGLSIGYSVDESSDEVMNGERVRLLKKVTLWEVSVVPFGMNPQAVVTNAKRLVSDEGLEEKAEFEKVLRDAGLSRKQAKTFISGGYSALLRDAETEGDADMMGQERDAVDMGLLLDQFKTLTTILRG